MRFYLSARHPQEFVFGGLVREKKSQVPVLFAELLPATSNTLLCVLFSTSFTLFRTVVVAINRF